MRTSILLRVGLTTLVGAAVLCWSAGAASAQEVSGPDVWAANCGSCHRLRSTDTYTAAQWNSVATHMGLVARLTGEETRAVREFLVGSAQARQAAATRRELVPELSLPGAGPSRGGSNALEQRSAGRASASRCCPAGAGRDLFRTRCAACHGAEGRGNGPAAAAMNPRPTNFLDPGQRTAATDSVARAVIEQGRRAMPAFGRMLNQAQIDSLVFFLRSLRQ